MGEQINALTYLGVPMIVIACVLALLFVLNVIGSIFDCFGKVWPKFVNFRRRLREKKEAKEKQAALLKDVKESLDEMKTHYSPEKLAERDAWMSWVNKRADKYDEAVEQIGELTKALIKNTEMTEEMFIQDSRTIILSFAEKIGNPNTIVSREECNRIFKVYNKYEEFLKEHNKTNGEVDIAIKVIKDEYATRLKSKLFLEDLRGYN
jgi:hypothetical protein